MIDTSVVGNRRALVCRISAGVVAVVALSLCLTGCKTLAKKSDTGVIVARRAQIRSSTAVVAANLLEVARNDQVDIIDTSTVPDTGEKWLRVRAHNEESTEGWIEARNVMPDTVLETSRKLAEEDKDTPPGYRSATCWFQFTPDTGPRQQRQHHDEAGQRFQL